MADLKLILPFWMRGVRATALVKTCQRWWDLVAVWIAFPLGVFDAQTASIGIVDLLAWQRGIVRFNGEDEALYRLRVKFAYVNAVDAGTPAGMQRIFARLGAINVTIDERLPDLDWDVLRLNLPQNAPANLLLLLDALLTQYGRTCRRWIFKQDLVTPNNVNVVCYTVINERLTIYPGEPA